MRAILGVLVVLAAFAAACGHSDGGSNNPTGPSGSSLVGNWKATRAEFVGVANPSQRVEVIARGTSITLSLGSTGSYTLTIAEPGKPLDVTSGVWTSTSDVLKMTPSGMSWSYEFDMSLNGNSLTLNGATFEFDVNGDDHDEQAKLNMTLTRG